MKTLQKHCSHQIRIIHFHSVPSAPTGACSDGKGSLHLVLSAAALGAELKVDSWLFRSFSTVLLHVYLGLPLVLFP
jgi:hypothetical protein